MSSNSSLLLICLAFLCPFLAQRLEFVTRPEKSKRKRHRQNVTYKCWRSVHFLQAPFVSYVYNIIIDLLLFIALLCATKQFLYFCIGLIFIDFCITVSSTDRDKVVFYLVHINQVLLIFKRYEETRIYIQHVANYLPYILSGIFLISPQFVISEADSGLDSETKSEINWRKIYNGVATSGPKVLIGIRVIVNLVCSGCLEPFRRTLSPVSQKYTRL